MELPQWIPKCEMFGAQCFDAVMSKGCYKQCQTNCIEECKMLFSNKNIDTFLVN